MKFEDFWETIGSQMTHQPGENKYDSELPLRAARAAWQEAIRTKHEDPNYMALLTLINRVEVAYALPNNQTAKDLVRRQLNELVDERAFVLSKTLVHALLMLFLDTQAGSADEIQEDISDILKAIGENVLHPSLRKFMTEQNKLRRQNV